MDTARLHSRFDASAVHHVAVKLLLLSIAPREQLQLVERDFHDFHGHELAMRSL